MFRLLLILAMTAMNVFIAVLPIVMIFGFFYLGKISGIIVAVKIVILGILLIYCGYLIFDFILGINMKIKQIIIKSYRFGGKYQKMLELPLSLIKTKYQIPHLKLFISDSAKPESYAMASVLEKYVCLSVGMVNALEIRAKSPEEFQILSCVILAKQAYNLKSGNYLPQMLLRINQRVVWFVEKVFGGFFKSLCFVIKFIPVVGVVIADGLKAMHKTTEFFLKMMNKMLMKIYDGVDFMAMLSIQQKSDEIASKIIGGKYVAHALAVTEEENIEMFTFKPRLRKRIEKIEKIERTNFLPKIFPLYQALYTAIIIFIFASTFFLLKLYI